MDKFYEALWNVGVPAHLKGFEALHDAIKLVSEDSTYLHSITTRLYPQVAVLQDASAAKVERTMRHAIHIAFDRIDDETIRKYFGAGISKFNPPSVTEFVATLAFRIREVEV